MEKLKKSLLGFLIISVCISRTLAETGSTSIRFRSIDSVSFFCKWTALDSIDGYPDIVLFNDGNEVLQIRVGVDADGDVRIINPDGSVAGETVDAAIISPGTEYNIWLEGEMGTGNNAWLNLYVSVGSNPKPSTPTLQVEDGKWYNQLEQMVLQSEELSALHYEHFEVDGHSNGIVPAEL